MVQFCHWTVLACSSSTEVCVFICVCLYVGLSIYVCLSLSLYVYDRPPIVAGVVEDRELIEVRKIPNRYGVAVGTRLYRLRVLPMDGDQLEVTRPDL